MILPSMSSSTKILVGLLAGVLVGLFLGEHAAVLKVVADGFVKLLQMMVLPYITLSIIASLGLWTTSRSKLSGSGLAPLPRSTALISDWICSPVQPELRCAKICAAMSMPV